MARFERPHPRVVVARGPGALLVVSDLHGNLADFERMVALLEADEDACLLLLGDLFHGPDVPADRWDDELGHLGDFYPDQSPALYRAWAALMDRWPERVTTLLGNHDHAHVGGPVVSKFYLDEAAETERHLTPDARDDLHRRLRDLPWIAASDCGVAFTHAASPTAPFDLDTLTNTPLDGYQALPLNAMIYQGFLGQLLWKRGASLSDTEAFLRHLNGAIHASVSQQRAQTYGHEIAREGWTFENDRLLNLSSSFGMTRARKTYLRLDLTASYPDARALVRGRELLPLYPDPHAA